MNFTGVFVFLFTVFCSTAFSQNDSIYRNPDTDAEFPGGKGEMLQFLAKNLAYPSCYTETENHKGIYRLTIEKDGKVSNVEIVKSFPEMDKEVLRCLSSMPNWIPASFGGKPVRSAFTVPVMIHLRE